MSWEKQKKRHDCFGVSSATRYANWPNSSCGKKETRRGIEANASTIVSTQLCRIWRQFLLRTDLPHNLRTNFQNAEKSGEQNCDTMHETKSETTTRNGVNVNVIWFWCHANTYTTVSCAACDIETWWTDQTFDEWQSIARTSLSELHTEFHSGNLPHKSQRELHTQYVQMRLCAARKKAVSHGRAEHVIRLAPATAAHGWIEKWGAESKSRSLKNWA